MPESVPLPLKGTITNQSQLERQVQDIAKKAGRNLKINLGTNAKDIKSLEQPLGRITGKADEFGKSMEAANARVIAFGASVGVINAVVQSFKSLVSTTIEVEKNLAKINSILKTTTSGLDSLKGQIFDIARNTEQTFDTVAEAALELSRQGLSATEVTKRLNDALILSRLSGISAAEAVSGLTAAVNSFTKAGLTTGEVLNKISNAANQFAVSERDLIEGFKRSASVAEQAGVSIDELGGIITAVQQKTARGGAVIGNSFKTIFTRIGRAENLELLRSIGVEISDLQGNILPATKLIENLAKELENLNDVQVRSITEKIGGGFQIAPLLAALSDYSSETSIAIKATEAFRNATDQAYQKNIILNQTLSAAINTTSLTIKELANSLGELGILDPFKEILNIVNSLAKGLKDLLPSKGEETGSGFAKGIIKGLSEALIKGGLAVFAFVLFNLSKNLLKFGVDSAKTFLGLNKEAEKLKNIQAQIIQTLISDKGVREQILAIERQSLSEEAKRAKQAEFFNSALRERVALTSQLNKISVGVAGGIRPGPATRRGAGGFLPIGAEQSDISKGVGGAPSGAKPVVIPNFAFGGGKRGTMVANTSEYIVPNFAGGGSAIFNQDMVKSMGLPSGAKKINAAGGFIPNFAAIDKSKYPTRESAELATNRLGKSLFTQSQISSAFGKKRTTTSTFNTYNANKEPSKAVMLVPDEVAFSANSLNKKYLKDKFITIGGQKQKVSQFIGGFAGVDPTLRNRESKYSQILGLEGIVDDNLAAAANETLREFERRGLLSIDPKNYKADEVKRLFLKEGGSGAYGAFKGAIFEGLINAISGGVESDIDSTLDVDFNKNRNILEDIFGLKGLGFDFGDFKSSDSKGNKEKYRNQILTNLPKALEKKAIKKAANASKGYIPNYAMSPLEDAIQREKEAGIPVNQIRINQDGKLRNSQNPDGLAVTNTRDEPTGRIPRNAAGGFIPNYQQGFNQVPAGDVFIGPIEEFNKSVGKSAKLVDKSAVATQKENVAREKSSNKMIALTFATGGLQQLFGALGEETSGATKTISAFIEGMSGAIFTAQIFSSLGVGLGSLKGGIGGTSRTGFNKRGRAAERATAGLGRNLSQGNLLSRGAGGALKGVAPVVGRIIGLGARLIPILGGAVIAFQLLNPILKNFGIDIAKIGSDIFDKLSGGTLSASRSLNELAKITDTVNKKLAERTLSGDISGKSIGQELLDQVKAAQRVRRAGIEVEGEVSQQDILQTRLREGRPALGDILNINRQGSTLIERGIEQAVDPVSGQSVALTEEVKKKFRDQLAESQQIINQAILATLDTEQLGAFDLTSEAGVSRALDFAREGLDSKDLEKLNKSQQELLNSVIRGQDIEEALKGFYIDVERALGGAARAAAERNKELLKEQLISARINKINKERFDSQVKLTQLARESVLQFKTQLEFEKQLEAASFRTGRTRALQLQNEIEGIEFARKKREELSRVASEAIQGSKVIETKLIPDASQGIDADFADRYKKTLGEIQSIIIKNGDIQITDIKRVLNSLELEETQRDELANQINIAVSETRTLLDLEKAKEFALDRQKKIQEERLRLQEQEFKIAQRNAKLQADIEIRQLQAEKARVQERQERASVLLGTSQPSSAIDIINRQAQRRQENLDRAIERRQNVQSVRERFTATAREQGIIGNQEVNQLLSELKRGVSVDRIEDIAKRLNEIANQSASSYLTELQKQFKAFERYINLATSSLGIEFGKFQTATKTFSDAVDRFTGRTPQGTSGPDPFASPQNAQAFLNQVNNNIANNPVPAPNINNLSQPAVGGITYVDPQTGQPLPFNVSPTPTAPTGPVADIFDVQGTRELFDTSTQQESIKEVERFYLEQRALSHQKDLELIAARDQASRVAIEFQYQQYEEILKINRQIAEVSEELLKVKDPTSGRAKELQEQLFALERSRKFLETAELSLEKQFESLGVTAEDATRNIKENLVSGAKQFVDTVSDGFVDAIIQGKSLGDVLRSAALDFTTQMAKAGLNNLFKQAAFGSGGGGGGFFGAIAGLFGKADGGMVSGGSGMKDDVPAVLMGGEYVMKKSAVQKYGPNFMDQLNNGILPGYANGGLVSGGNRTESGVVASSWTSAASAISEYQKYRMSENEKARTQSGVLSSSWTPKADEDNVETEDKLPASEVRTESGLIASSWTKLADHRKAQASMLTGGEYVVGKKAADKFGKGFLDALNNGEIQKYANGGLVSGSIFTKDEEKFRTTDIFGNRTPEGYFKQQTGGDYFAPGLYGAGNITGQKDLIGFATQGFTSGAKDFVGNVGDAQVIALEPESMRLTNFGRTQGNPLQRATQEAKGQAFDLYAGYQADVIAWKKQVEELKKQRKAQQKAMLTNLAISFATMALPAAGKGISNALKSGGGFSKMVSQNGLFSTLGTLGKSAFTGAPVFGQGNGNFGGMFNMFNARGGITAKNVGSYIYNNPASKISQQLLSSDAFMSSRPSAIPVGGGVGGQLYNNLNSIGGSVLSLGGAGLLPTKEQGKRFFQNRFATGGYIPETGGIDSVSALLSGGEFVLNRAATERVGTSALQDLNSGGQGGLGGENMEELIEKLDLLIDATRENAGEINISVTGAGGGENGGGGSNQGTEENQATGDAAQNELRKAMAEEIKVRVLEVIRQEKRLGGALRS